MQSFICHTIILLYSSTMINYYQLCFFAGSWDFSWIFWMGKWEHVTAQVSLTALRVSLIKIFVKFCSRMGGYWLPMSILVPTQSNWSFQGEDSLIFLYHQSRREDWRGLKLHLLFLGLKRGNYSFPQVQTRDTGPPIVRVKICNGLIFQIRISCQARWYSVVEIFLLLLSCLSENGVWQLLEH